MTIRLEGPYDAPITVTLLPNPEKGDEESLDIETSLRRSMNGAYYTYVKSGPNRKLVYNFENVGRGQILECIEFFKKFRGQFVKLTNFRNETWKVIINDDTFDFTTDKLTRLSGAARNEAGSFVLNLIGEKISG